MKTSIDLIYIFNKLFKNTYDTILVGGASEPLYLPKNKEHSFNQVIFTQDYYASALHEIAHWCVAGDERRQQVDYGYWYKPDGRDDQEQQLFEQVEVKPQALEWIFSVAAGTTFRVSADNLANANQASENFKSAIYQQVQIYLRQGLPKRAEIFKQRLLIFYDRINVFESLKIGYSDLISK